MASLLAVSLADEVVNQESILILPLELLLTEVTDGFQGLLLNALEDLILGLLVLVDRLEDLD